MSTEARRWLAVGAILAAIGVAFGAFGAHGLANALEGLGYTGDEVVQRIERFETAVRYQLVHALALCILAIVVAHLRQFGPHSKPIWKAAAWAFLLGVVVFSGFLYALTFVGPDLRWLGAIVPLGGLSMIVGWLMVAVGALRQ